MPAMPRPSFFGPISAPLELHRKLLGRLPVGGGELGGGELGGGVVLGGGVPVPPVQVVPLRAKLAGAGLLPVHEPLNANDTVALLPMLALQLTFDARTCPPLWLTAPERGT